MDVRKLTLRCHTCDEWKPDAEFSRNQNEPRRRYRKRECKSCTSAKQRERAAGGFEGTFNRILRRADVSR